MGQKTQPAVTEDYQGLEWVGLSGIEHVTSPTEADYEELELLLMEQQAPEGDLNKAIHLRIPFDFKRCYELAESGSSATEIARIMNLEPYVVHNNIRARYGCGWKEYQERAQAALGGEIRAKIISAVRNGRDGLVLIYAAKLMNVFPQIPQQVEVSGPGGGPIQSQSALVVLSAEDLQKKRQALMKVVDRPSRFSVSGELAPTLLLTGGK